VALSCCAAWCVASCGDTRLVVAEVSDPPPQGNGEGGSSPVCPTETEPNGTLLEATSVNAPTCMSGEISSEGDEDYVRVTFAPPRAYRVRLQPPLDLTTYDDEAEITVNTNRGSLDATASARTVIVRGKRAQRYTLYLE